jgi:hypothetical protein
MDAYAWVGALLPYLAIVFALRRLVHRGATLHTHPPRTARIAAPPWAHYISSVPESRGQFLAPGLPGENPGSSLPPLWRWPGVSGSTPLPTPSLPRRGDSVIGGILTGGTPSIGTRGILSSFGGPSMIGRLVGPPMTSPSVTVPSLSVTAGESSRPATRDPESRSVDAVVDSPRAATNEPNASTAMPDAA